MTMKISRMKSAQRVNMIAGAINGVHQGTGAGKAKANPMPSKRTNMKMNPKPVSPLLSGRRRGPYNQE